MDSIEQILDDALALGEDGRWEEMATMLRHALEQHPDDAYLLGWLAVAEQELDNDGVAYELFRQCLAQEPLDPHLLALAGAGLAAYDDPEAETALRAAALTGPDVPMARLHYGAYLAREGLFDDALEQLRAAVELAPDDPSIHGELATALALKGDLDEAASVLETALDMAPDDDWARVLLGLIQVGRGEMEAGAEALIQGAQEREEDGEAQILAALAAAAAGWDDAAQDALARAGYAVEGREVSLMEEAEERILAGREEAERMLRETIGPSALRERLSHPL